MTQADLLNLRASANDLKINRKEQLDETRTKTEEMLKMAEARSITADFTEKVAELFWEDDARVKDGKTLVTIVFNPNDNGWVLMRSYWENCGVLPAEYFKRDDDEKVFDLVKADFEAVGIGICDKHVYDGETITFRAYIKEN